MFGKRSFLTFAPNKMKNNPMTKECFLRALQRHRERVIYAFGWAVVLLSPFLMMYFRSRNSSDPLPWGFYGAVWATMGVFLVFFLFHNRFVAPLFFRPRKGRYFIFAFLLVLLLGVFQYLTFPLFGPPPPEKRSRHEVIVRDKEGKTVRGVEVRVLRFAKPGIVERVDLASLFILALMFGVNLGVKIYFRSEDTSRELMLLQQEKLSNQLKYLKAQINPHFFMNTLNNIHALVDIDPGRAQSSIILLSRMMRYVVYESESTSIPLQKEVEFLSNYITLMRLRFTSRVHLTVDMQPKMQGEVPPLLFIMFVENAFKHGVSYQRDTHIHILMEQVGERIHFFCENPKIDSLEDVQGGVGMRNVRKRLDLIYGDCYTLRIDDDPNRYTVDLTVPMEVSESRS